MNKDLNKIVITSSLEFEQVIKELKESLDRISDCINNEKNLMKKIDKTNIWTSDVQNIVYSKYQELSDCYSPVIESLSIYIKYLEIVNNNYKNAMKAIENSIENNLDNLDVN